MKRTLAIVAAAGLLGSALLTGCSGGVDRAALKQKIVDTISGQGLTAEQTACVANSIDGFSDDDLKNLDSDNPSAELSARLTDAVTACILGGGTTPAPSAS